ncbi:hypothetical protein [Oenococcus sp.]|uniref:hypothetical protein n=1 Tax=Oenococcus sp. TaxID=1979414 RepID=UPI0039ED712E
MFYSAITFWLISLFSWVALQFFARQYHISDLPFWTWLLPADFFLAIGIINKYLSFNFQYILITAWLILWLSIIILLIWRSEDRRSLKRYWSFFINLSGILLLLEVIGIAAYIFLNKD